MRYYLLIGMTILPASCHEFIEEFLLSYGKLTDANTAVQFIPAASWLAGPGRLLPPLFVSALAIAAGQVHYLLFHTVVELFSIIMALTALVVATTSRHFTRNHFTVYIAIAIGWCAGLDLIHTLSYLGMGLLVKASADLPTQLWIAARFIQALALLSAPLFLRKAISIGYVHTFYGLAAFGATVWIFSGHFPVMYVEGQGLTPLKIGMEYLIIGLLLGACLLLWKNRRAMSPTLFLCILSAIVMMIVSEFAFTRYVSLYGLSNEIGHVCKIFAYWYVYLALVQSTLREPFDALSRTVSTYDAVPDPAFVAGADGLIRQANLAAARHAGLAPAELVGQPMHPLFHGVATAVADCPVCTRIGRGDHRFSVEIDLDGGARTMECTVAPFIDAGRDRSYVQVVRDVTERKRLLAEREVLVYNLGKRVKELRCQYVISNVLEQPGIDVDGLLRQVLKALPEAFRFPDHAYSAYLADGVLIGATGSQEARHCLRSDLVVNQQIKGSLQVFYSAALDEETDPFLAEERQLLDTVAQRVSEAIERIQVAEQVQRLTYLYGMLSATNRVIVRCRSNEELLARVFEALVLRSAFPMLFIATSETGSMPFRMLHSHGIDTDAFDSLSGVLDDAGSSLGNHLTELNNGSVVCSELQVELRDPGKHADWFDYLGRRGISERAILPLLCEDRLVGFICLYAPGPGAFDQAQRDLLNEMATDISFALGGIAQSERRRLAELRAESSDLRFREIFELSPVPMQIQSLAGGGAALALNRAHQRWLGYKVEDIANDEQWFNLVYPDPVMQAALRIAWARSIEEAKTSGSAVNSPELRLRCKDGRERIARGTMTLIGEDAVIAWTDLTEIRRSEEALRASELHFRTMIEQAIMGIYVRRNGRFVYVNPRYCEMIGWTADEVNGREVLEFTTNDAANLDGIHRAWDQLDAGERSVHYYVSLVCKDGQIREFSLHANPIVWDGDDATIVLAEDITERKRSGEVIAGYVKQLEASMRGTLQAVSNMIDLRDPYTAGHERRVGIIAGAIAHEMGWADERCKSLELIGLVHDIGKIAVPAEILSKPGRLSPMEMELVRGHAQAGYEILKDVPFSFPVAEVIRQHHERLDGSGYPRGLKGEEIMIEARILAVADVLESMAAHRPYRPALGIEVALDELKHGRDTSFDPQVVDAVLRLVHEQGYVLPV